MKKILEKIKNKTKNILGIKKIEENINNLKILNGKKLSLHMDNLITNNFHDYEFKVFSQFGEDGLIQFLIKNLDISCKKFIEFGVEDYEEANTRFLLENNNWSGLIIDSSKENTDYIKKQNYYWKYNIKVENEFITKENINTIIKKNEFKEKIGILSIDIDGNDYWIWNEIEIIKPDIVIIEYNARLGSELSMTIPYKSNFNRMENLKKNNYGASLSALNKLGEKKGYKLVGTNSNGNNAFFVDKDKMSNTKIKAQDPEKCFNLNSFSEDRDEKGKITKDLNNFDYSDFIKI
jgi:hypothetical protein